MLRCLTKQYLNCKLHEILNQLTIDRAIGCSYFFLSNKPTNVNPSTGFYFLFKFKKGNKNTCCRGDIPSGCDICGA